VIANGSVVRFEYTLSHENGEVIESNRGEEPVTYVHGEGQIIPGLEHQLGGMKLHEEKRIRVEPLEGYGPVDPSAFVEVAKEEIPVEARRVGATLYAQGPRGENVQLRVHEVKDETVVLDFNHPLAGKTLIFDVKILDIQPREPA
jgi:FKBP-type peptidyl-prolyl cis-trans isomerase SlyD